MFKTTDILYANAFAENIYEMFTKQVKELVSGRLVRDLLGQLEATLMQTSIYSVACYGYTCLLHGPIDLFVVLHRVQQPGSYCYE